MLIWKNGVNTMRVLATTEYQDVYRVTDGVLLVVNKFVPIQYNGQNIYLYGCDIKAGKYDKGCQDCLKVLKNDFVYYSTTIPKGTVLYNKCPVKATTDELEFQYQIKTTGDSFSGDAHVMENMLSDILYRIRQGKIKDNVSSFIKIGV